MTEIDTLDSFYFWYVFVLFPFLYFWRKKEKHKHKHHKHKHHHRKVSTHRKVSQNLNRQSSETEILQEKLATGMMILKGEQEALQAINDDDEHCKAQYSYGYFWPPVPLAISFY